MVTFDVPPVRGDAACPVNEEVRYDVRLDQPLDGRSLVDGWCLTEDAGSATPECASARRWPEPGDVR